MVLCKTCKINPTNNQQSDLTQVFLKKWTENYYATSIETRNSYSTFQAVLPDPKFCKRSVICKRKILSSSNHDNFFVGSKARKMTSEVFWLLVNNDLSIG